MIGHTACDSYFLFSVVDSFLNADPGPVLRGLQSCLSCSAPPDNSGFQVQCNGLMGNAKQIVAKEEKKK